MVPPGGGPDPGPRLHHVAGKYAGNPVLPADTGGTSVVGHGTDVFGRYAAEENRLGQVLDIDALNGAGMLVHRAALADHDFDAAAGATAGDYLAQLGGTVGLTGTPPSFGGEAQEAFVQDACRKEDYSYVTLVEHLWSASLEVDGALRESPARLRPYLTAAARNAIDDTDPTRRWTGAEMLAA